MTNKRLESGLHDHQTLVPSDNQQTLVHWPCIKHGGSTVCTKAQNIISKWQKQKVCLNCCQCEKCACVCVHVFVRRRQTKWQVTGATGHSAHWVDQCRKVHTACHLSSKKAKICLWQLLKPKTNFYYQQMCVTIYLSFMKCFGCVCWHRRGNLYTYLHMHSHPFQLSALTCEEQKNRLLVKRRWESGHCMRN